MSYSTSGPVETILRKEDTVDPVAGNDNTQGYAIKSRWINTSSNEEWVCTDASTGAAVWELTTAEGDVVGPASANDTAVALYDGTTGKLLSNSATMQYAAGQLSLIAANAATLRIVERSAASSNVAGSGIFWVKNDNPTTPWFTDDVTGDYQLAPIPLSGAGVPGVATGDGYPLGTTYADTTNDVGYILVDNTTGVNVWWTGGAGGGGGGMGQWDYVTGGAAPASTKITANTDLMSTVTTLNFHDTSLSDNTFSAAMANFTAGDYLVIRDNAGGAAFGTFLITAVADNTTYWTFTVTATETSGSFTATNTYDVWDLSAGNVVGPASSATNALARFSDTTGKVLTQSTALTYDGAGNLKNNSGSAHLTLNEHSTAPSSGTGDGKYYVKADAPNTPWFMDDTGVARHLSRPTPTTLASNALIDVDATEVVIGGAYLDGSSGGVYSWEILGTYNDNGGGGNQDVIVTLYDRGPDGTPVAGVLRSTITITSLGTLDRVSQALTVAASPGTDTDEIDSDEPRLYEVRAKLDANGGVDTARILNVKFVES